MNAIAEPVCVPAERVRTLRAALVCLALLFGQWIGLLHAFEHGIRGAPTHASVGAEIDADCALCLATGQLAQPLPAAPAASSATGEAIRVSPPQPGLPAGVPERHPARGPPAA